ncbi:YppE family protein [Sutcliffiella horikoshii]|uniref:YppE family protein n=1 Tax=Sutcliffiella horikoshii TaxID=79883 RepID=UPI001CBD7B2F|nr:YppE family protein [Sutcliffiella horikoshii]UAL45724.1 YppE family protein [Sutcliffiella horikoshii]
MSGNDKSVRELTKQILMELDRIEENFMSAKASKQEPDFFQTVKPYADGVFATVEQWESTVKNWILSDKPKYIHVQQIDSTVENINMVAVQCFYPDTREKRFKGMIQSIRYVLNDTISKNI